MQSTLVLILGCLILGFLAKHRSYVSEVQGLNGYVLNIALPAIILLTVPQTKSFDQVLIPFVFHWIHYGLIFILIWKLSKLFQWDRQTSFTLMTVLPLGNTAFLGIPMVAGIFGSDWIASAVLYDQLGSGIAFLIAVSVIVPIFQMEKKLSVKEIILTGGQKLLTFPPFISLVLAIMLIGQNFPPELVSFLSSISQTLTPVALFSVGWSFQLIPEKRVIKPLVFGLSLKMILLPLLIFLIFLISNFKISTDFQVSFIQAAMPPMVTAGMLASQSGMNKHLSSALVAYGLILSFVTLPFWQMLLEFLA